MAKSRAILGVMVGDLVSLTLDPRNQFRVTPHSFTDKKESGFGVVSLENLQNLGRKNWVGTIIKRKGNERGGWFGLDTERSE